MRQWSGIKIGGRLDPLNPRFPFVVTNRYGTISLASAASQAGLTWEGLAHSAIVDARMAAGVVNAIAAYHLELLQEQARLKI